MYSIKERTNRNGEISYQINVKIIDFEGKAIQRAKTWKPSFLLTESQIGLAINRVAKEFETEVIAEYGGRTKAVATGDTFFNDYVVAWIERMKKRISESYYASLCNSYAKISSLTENYRLSEFVPSIIEDIYTQIDNMQKETHLIVANDTFINIFESLKMKRTKWCKANGIPVPTMRDVLNKHKISHQTASKVAKGCGKDVEEVFTVRCSTEPFKSSYRESMKKCIRMCLTDAVKLGVIDRNYAHKLYVTTHHPDSNKVSSMTVEEAQLLYKTCQSLHIKKKFALIFLLETGLRKGELVGLNWSDFDFEKQTVRIERQYETVSKCGLVLKEPKTPSAKRTFQLNSSLVELVLQYKDWSASLMETYDEQWKAEDCVLRGINGKRLHPTTIRNWLDEALKIAGIPHYPVHSLRHTYITLLSIEGVSPVTIASRVGHKKTSTTMNIYADYLGSSDKEASAQINQFFESEQERKRSSVV